MKETEEYTINGKIFYDYGLEKFLLLKCPYYPKLSVDLMQFHPIKFQRHFSQKYDPKIHSEQQKIPNSQSNLEKKRQVEASHFLISNCAIQL